MSIDGVGGATSAAALFAADAVAIGVETLRLRGDEPNASPRVVAPHADDEPRQANRLNGFLADGSNGILTRRIGNSSLWD